MAAFASEGAGGFTIAPDLADYEAKLARCRTPEQVQEAHEGRQLAERLNVQPYPAEHRQAAARRMAEVTRATRR